MVVTPITKKRILYSDFGKDLTIHPVSADVTRNLNEEAIKESIKNIILTDKGERPFQPNFGCDVRKRLFDNLTPDTLHFIRDDIITAIQNFEPRCILNGVDISGDLNSNILNITVVFTVINSETPTTLSLLLNRIR